MDQGPSRRHFDPEAMGALNGVRVIDLSRLVAGNLLTKVLADHGADVVKVEPLEGDSLRAWKVEGVSTAWKGWARNKKSIALDLRMPDGIDIVRALARDCAILVESFKPGVLEEMGLDPSDLLAANPRLVIVRISGWGQSGPYRHKPGFGTLIEAYAGYADANGFADREPVLPPMYMADGFAGLYGASAAMIALRVAESPGGAGQVVDLSLLDPLFAMMEPQIANFQLTGRVKERTGSRSGNSAPRNAYRTSDGQWVALSASTNGMAHKLFRAIEQPDLIDDPRFLDNASRLHNVEALDAILSAFIEKRSQADILDLFNAAGVSVGPIMNAQSLSTDPYMIERESLIEVPDSDMGWVPMHGAVPRFSATPGIFARPAPALGEHSREILAPLLGAERFAALLADRVIFASG
jgi:crotonobetainyl-CoA:carnitine CoA-transferase CaiB-like acyl-CoA transferase